MFLSALEEPSFIINFLGDVYLNNLKALPEGVHFNNLGRVDLGRLETLHKGVQFNNKGGFF